MIVFDHADYIAMAKNNGEQISHGNLMLKPIIPKTLSVATFDCIDYDDDDEYC